MANAERFTDMAALRGERERLTGQRDICADVLNSHWERLREPGFQKAIGSNLLRGVARSVFSWSSAKQLAGAISPEMIGGIAGMALGGRAKTKTARLLAMGLSAAVPFIAERLRGSGKGADVLTELDTSWERLKTFLRERREARRERRADSTH